MTSRVHQRLLEFLNRNKTAWVTPPNRSTTYVLSMPYKRCMDMDDTVVGHDVI